MIAMLTVQDICSWLVFLNPFLLRKGAKKLSAIQQGRVAMSEDTQVPSDGNTSAGPSGSGKAPGSVDVEQPPKENDSAKSDKAPGSKDTEQSHEENGAAESGEAPGSKDAEQPRKDYGPEQRPKYAVGTDSPVLHSIVGDNPQVTINYYADVIQGKKIKISKDGDDDGVLNQKSDRIGELISKILKLEREGTAFFPEGESTVRLTKLPETEEEFSEWYYRLSDYEQCYVQVAAVLHGAPAHEVSKRADSLYKRLYEHIANLESFLFSGSQSADGRETQQRGTSRFSDTFLRKMPGRELRVNTHTMTRRIEGVERLYWQDVDSYGLSTFGFHLLAFLSSEFISRGEHGQISLKVLEDWSKESSDEISWKAARSYGVVLWCHNTDRLGSIAEEWAKADSLRSRRRTAELLDGAFEIERLKTDKVKNESTSSVVLRLMDDWVNRVHAEFGKVNTGASMSNINLGCTVASAYGWIGKRSPDIALDGLEHLLKLPQSRSSNETDRIFATGVSTYVTLTWSGHVRYVLERLAASAERLSHHRDLPRKAEERQKYRRQREVHLNAILEAFFLIAATSLTELGDYHTTSYSLTEPFPTNPAIPDPYGRDVLLLGLFTASDVRENITALLCAAIVEKKSKPVFEFLRHWADIVLKTRRGQEGKAEEIYVSFRQFIVNLGKTVDEWCLDLEKLGLRSPQAFDVFKNRLEQWYIESRFHSFPTSALAQEILNQLND